MIEIKAVDHEQKVEQLYDLHKLVFNNKISPAYWQWKHFQNPYVQVPEAIAALENDRVIGAIIFMPLMLKVGGKTIKAVQACDGMVHPEYRKKDVFLRILAYSGPYYAHQGYQIIYAFANRYSLPGVLKVGWKKVVQIEQLIMINNALIISRKLSNPIMAKIIGRGWDFYQRHSIYRYRDTENNFTLKTYQNYHRDLENINALSDHQSVELARTEEFLRWRFDQHPVFNYRYLVAYYKKEPAGYMVVSSIKQDGITCGKIVDYLVKDNNAAYFLYLIEQSLTELQKDSCDLVFAWAVKEKLRGKLLSDYNFKSLLKFPYQRINPDYKYFTVNVLNPGVLSGSIQWNLNMVFTDTN